MTPNFSEDLSAFPPEQTVFPIAGTNLRVLDGDHPLLIANRSAIRENWEREIAANPALFDGRMPERHRFIRGMVSWIGGRQVALRYTRDARYAGSTKYPLKKMIRFAIDAITSFSIIPLRISAWMGLISAVFAVGLLVYTLVQWFEGNVITGWSSIMAAISALSAIQLIALGTLGEYVGRLVQEHKRRPMFMIDCVVQGEVTSELADNFSELDTASRRSELGKLPAAIVTAKPIETAVGR